MKFNYQARNEQGQTQIGVIEASSRDAALKLLAQNKFFITVLEEEKGKPLYARRLAFFDRIPVKEVMLFSRELAILFRSEVPLVEALRTIALQTKNANFKEKILEMSEKVEGGTSLSGAIAAFPDVFSPYYVSIVKSGETSGSLSKMFDSLATHLEREYALNSKIRGALTYPFFVVFVGIAVLFLMMFFVIPNLTKVLGDAKATLPFVTKMVIGLAAFLHTWWWLLFLFLALLVFLVRHILRTKEGKQLFDQFVLQVPFLGSLMKMIYLARFAENLSTLISSGIAIVAALEITQDIVGNSVYRAIIGNAKDAVGSGKSIGQVLSQYPGEFPPVFTEMVQVGEKSGTLDATLLDVVQFYEQEVSHTVDSFLSVLEPVLIVVLGVLVGGMMGAILLPLYQSLAF